MAFLKARMFSDDDAAALRAKGVYLSDAKKKSKGLSSSVKKGVKSIGTGAAKVATKVGRAAGGVLKAVGSTVGGILGLSAREKAMEDTGEAEVRTRQVAKRRDAGHGVVSYTGEENY